MLRPMFAIVVASLICLALSGPTQAAPIAPLPQGYTIDLGNVTKVWWRNCWRDRWGRLHCRRCWRDSWGRVRCW